jgi:DNA-binding transcriptional LysR family regulator
MAAALSDLDAFAAVARHRSFRRAATERRVSPSLLSQTVRRLEERLGVRLLNRTTRAVSPTQAGEALLAELGPALDQIARAVDGVNAFRGSPTGLLRLNAPKPIAHYVIAPMIGAFRAAYPGIEVELSAQDALIDVVAEKFDAGVRFGESLAQDMVAVPFGPRQRMAVFGAPSYFAARERPRTVEDLLGHVLIRNRFPGGGIGPWEFEKDGKAVSLVPEGPVTVDDPNVELRLALDGVGLAFMFEPYGAAHVAAGRLELVLPDWCPEFEAPFLYMSSRRLVPSALRAFIDFARQYWAPELTDAN